MRVVIRDHFGKGLAFARALSAAGHSVANEGPADVLLLDLDDPDYGYRDVIESYKAIGAAVLLYPHGANPPVVYDGMIEPSRHVDANLVIGPGHAEVLRRLDYPNPTHVTGWSLCPLAPFRPTGAVRRVLFAPTHPSGFGVLHEVEQENNARTFELLRRGPWSLTVRHIGTLEQNGLRRVPGVRYVRGEMNQATNDIDAADVVVSAPGTFPSLSVARGVPTVLCGQGLGATRGRPDEELIGLRRPERYADYIRFPFDAEDGPIAEVLHAAARDEDGIRDWRRRFVGDALDPVAVARLVETIVDGSVPTPRGALGQTGAFTTVALLDELLEQPELLAAYCSALGPDDDATLVLWGPGTEEATLLDAARAAVAAAGLAEDALPDVLLLPLPGSPAADRTLARRAHAMLGETPRVGELGALPRFGAGDAFGLRDAAAAVWPRGDGALVAP